MRNKNKNNAHCFNGPKLGVVGVVQWPLCGGAIVNAVCCHWAVWCGLPLSRA